MSTSTRQCACCLRPYPYEQFVKILAPSVDDYLTIQTRQLENISSSVVHQVQNSEAFAQLKEQMQQLAGIITETEERYQQQEAQLKRLNAQMEKSKKQAGTSSTEQRITELESQIRQRTVEQSYAANDQAQKVAKMVSKADSDLREALYAGINLLRAQMAEQASEITKKLSDYAAAHDEQMLQLERRLDKCEASVQMIHGNSQLLVEYVDRRLAEVQENTDWQIRSAIESIGVQTSQLAKSIENVGAAVSESAPQPCQVLSVRRMTVATNTNTDSLRSSSYNDQHYRSVKEQKPSLVSTSSRNSSDFYSASQLHAQSAGTSTEAAQQTGEAAQQTSRVCFSDRSAQAEAPATESRGASAVQLFPYYSFGQQVSRHACSGGVQVSAQRWLKDESAQGSRFSLNSTVRQRPSALNSSYAPAPHLSPQAMLIKQTLQQNDALIAKYTNLSSISAVAPAAHDNPASVAPSLSPSLIRSAPPRQTTSPPVTSPGEQDTARSNSCGRGNANYDLDNLFQNVLNVQSRISPQPNLTVAAFQSTQATNSAQTDALTRQRPEKVLEKGRQLIEKVDDAYGYLKVLSAASRD